MPGILKGSVPKLRQGVPMHLRMVRNDKRRILRRSYLFKVDLSEEEPSKDPAGNSLVMGEVLIGHTF